MPLSIELKLELLDISVSGSADFLDSWKATDAILQVFVVFVSTVTVECSDKLPGTHNCTWRLSQTRKSGIIKVISQRSFKATTNS